VGSPIEAAGRSVLVEVQSSTTAGPVLAVPVTAIYSRPDGSTFVTVTTNDATADVTVTAGRTSGGWVEVTPASSESLREGALVVVGLR
jgi:multidrug efflux pump subunit AcrA (membrane-fusion protein)